jgi:hypothetical protein
MDFGGGPHADEMDAVVIMDGHLAAVDCARDDIRMANQVASAIAQMHGERA